MPLASKRAASFDEIVKNMGLSPEQFEGSAELKEWVRANMGQKYVPIDLLIAWGFFKSFQKRYFRVVAWLSVAVFSIFMIAELGDFLNVIFPDSSLNRHHLLGTALSVTTDGMVALLFIALTFSWVHEKYEDLADEVFIAKIDIPRFRDARGAGNTT